MLVRISTILLFYYHVISRCSSPDQIYIYICTYESFAHLFLFTIKMRKDETSRLHSLSFPTIEFLFEFLASRYKVDRNKQNRKDEFHGKRKETSGEILRQSIPILLQTIFKHELNSNLKSWKFKIYSPSFFFSFHFCPFLQICRNHPFLFFLLIFVEC